MRDVVFALPGIALTILCWGTYGSVLHKGQVLLEGRLKPLICVGIAYLIFAVIMPAIILSVRGGLSGGWNLSGISWSTAAGAAGTFGALGIILALSSGGKPIYVMPLVFGGAPIVNVFVSMYFQGLRPRDIGGRLPFFLAGVVMVAVGAAMVLIFAPKSPSKPAGHATRASAVKRDIDPPRSGRAAPSQTEASPRSADDAPQDRPGNA